MEQKQWLEIDTAKKKITLQTDTGDILIKAKEKIRLECKDLEIDASNNIKIKAGKNIDQSCTKLCASSSGATDLKASANMTIKGAKIDLNP